MELFLGLGVIVIIVLGMSVVWFKRRGDMAFRDLVQMRRENDRVNEQLRNLSERWETVTQSIGEGIILIDSDQRVLDFNPAVSNLLGSSLQVGQLFNEMAWQLQIQPLVQDVITGRAELLVHTAVREDRTFQIGVRACSSGQACGAVIVLNEVTELQRLGRTRRDFIANISHELRTPVTSLQLLAETLANELPTNAPIASDLLTKLRGQIDALRQLTDEMMDLSLVESGQLPIKLVETSVRDLVTPVLDVLSPQAERKRITLRVQIGQNLQVLADPVGIRKVLSNLIHNAIKFTREKGHVTIDIRSKNEWVEFSVTDDGIGIPANDLPRIFERFYKVDYARTQSGVSGTGLGLAIAKHIVEGHGGSIWAQSVEGKGSTFGFLLPNANP